jgi:hypothetical protein
MDTAFCSLLADHDLAGPPLVTPALLVGIDLNFGWHLPAGTTGSPRCRSHLRFSNLFAKVQQFVVFRFQPGVLKGQRYGCS